MTVNVAQKGSIQRRALSTCSELDLRDLNVEEEYQFFGSAFGVSGGEIDKRTPKLYDFSGLVRLKSGSPDPLRGMKQKLGLAVA
jgi:ABC-type Na+ transport system ATPase subunit NatA